MTPNRDTSIEDRSVFARSEGPPSISDRRPAANGEAAYGRTLADYFHLTESEHLATPWPQDSVFAVTRLRSDTGLPDVTNPAREPTLHISVAIKPVPLGAYELWLDGKTIDVPYIPAYHTTVLDFLGFPVCWVAVGFDYVHYHVPRSGLDDLALEYGIPPIGDYRFVMCERDLVLEQATRTLLPFLGSPEPLQPLALDQLSLTIGAHVLQRYGGLPGRAPISRGGLALWQRRRAVEMLRAHLDGSIRLQDLARECDLSVGHFARAFKQSFGVSTLRWLNERRVEHSQQLMMTTSLPLADIAIQSGFSDQATMTRMFHKLAGQTPARWRRAQAEKITTSRKSR
jgi:AraC family transcriptional regulator